MGQILASMHNPRQSFEFPVTSGLMKSSRPLERGPASGPRVPASPSAFDVRVRSELAHRRKAVAILRQALRVVSLHLLDEGALWLAALGADAVTDVVIASPPPLANT